MVVICEGWLWFVCCKIIDFLFSLDCLDCRRFSIDFQVNWSYQKFDVWLTLLDLYLNALDLQAQALAPGAFRKPPCLMPCLMSCWCWCFWDVKLQSCKIWLTELRNLDDVTTDIYKNRRGNYPVATWRVAAPYCLLLDVFLSNVDCSLWRLEILYFS